MAGVPGSSPDDGSPPVNCVSVYSLGSSLFILSTTRTCRADARRASVRRVRRREGSPTVFRDFACVAAAVCDVFAECTDAVRIIAQMGRGKTAAHDTYIYA